MATTEWWYRVVATTVDRKILQDALPLTFGQYRNAEYPEMNIQGQETSQLLTS